MIDISTTETLKMEKKFPGSRHKFPGKREISKPQISQEICRLDFPVGNTICVTPELWLHGVIIIHFYSVVS